jgi:hypothetical protein
MPLPGPPGTAAAYQPKGVWTSNPARRNWRKYEAWVPPGGVDPSAGPPQPRPDRHEPRGHWG